jgi:hypothetical protein
MHFGTARLTINALPPDVVQLGMDEWTHTLEIHMDS